MFYKEDFEVNSSLVSTLLVCLYRFGNAIHRRNGGRGFLWKLYRLVDFVSRLVTHCEIPGSATIGPGLRLDHNGNGVVIHAGATIGANARIFHQVTLGANTFADAETFGPPIVGDNVYIGSGAKLIGSVRVGDDVRIGANAVVTTDVPDGATAVGVPARVIHR